MDMVKRCVCGRAIVEEYEELCYACRMNKKMKDDRAERYANNKKNKEAKS